MPFINGKYHMNPHYGRALEHDRLADEEHRSPRESRYLCVALMRLCDDGVSPACERLCAPPV